MPLPDENIASSLAVGAIKVDAEKASSSLVERAVGHYALLLYALSKRETQLSSNVDSPSLEQILLCLNLVSVDRSESSLSKMQENARYCRKAVDQSEVITLTVVSLLCFGVRRIF